MGADVPQPVSHVAYGYATHVCILNDDGTIRKMVAAHDVGRVVFTGTPAQMAAERSTLTGKYLAQYVEEVNDDAPE